MSVMDIAESRTSHWLYHWFCFWLDSTFKKHMSGEEFEEYVYEILKRIGYKHIRLTQKSGDYGVDILATYKGVHYAFQCKYYSKPVGVSAVQQAYSGCEYYDYDEAVVVTNQTFTRQAHALAMRNGVILWDGEKLNQMRRLANRHALFYRFHHQKYHIHMKMFYKLFWKLDMLQQICFISI